MSWHWKPVEACDLDQLVDALNPQMKSLENGLGVSRPAIMSGYPNHVGAIVDHAKVTVGATTDETALKSTSFRRGAISAKGGFRVTAGGNVAGTGGVKTMKLKWGGILIATLSVATGTASWLIIAEFWNIDNTQNQRWLVRATDNVTLETMTVGSDDVDTG
jgi:hypothetical protein